MKILIVESDTGRQRQLRTILTSLGHKSAETESASDGQAAIKMLRKKRFDCCFVSMSSPQFDPLPLLKNIRSGGSSKNLPVVMFSSEATKEHVIASHEAGASGFLTYPFSVSDVEGAIRKATTGR